MNDYVSKTCFCQTMMLKKQLPKDAYVKLTKKDGFPQLTFSSDGQTESSFFVTYCPVCGRKLWEVNKKEVSE